MHITPVIPIMYISGSNNPAPTQTTGSSSSTSRSSGPSGPSGSVPSGNGHNSHNSSSSSSSASSSGSSGGGGGGSYLHPALGVGWAHAVNTRFVLEENQHGRQVC